jgi:hypothetical protein
MPLDIDFERQILEEAATSPVVAIIRLTLEIERELRKLLAVLGLLPRYGAQTLPEALTLLEGQVELPTELKDSLQQFWSLRNSVIHGQTPYEHLALRALDYGLRILSLLRSIPRHSYIVYRSAVPVFKDSQCISLREDVKGIILETVSPEGNSLGKHIYPSTVTYPAGTHVSWEWSSGNSWNETWYRNPDSGEIELAWSRALEFIGRDLDSI